MAEQTRMAAARLRARLDAGDFPEDAREIAWLLDETERLTALLSGGSAEYAVQPVIDGRPGNIEDYGTDRDLLLVRLEQPQPDGYQLTVLTRRTVRTPWHETTDPEIIAALSRTGSTDRPPS